MVLYNIANVRIKKEPQVLFAALLWPFLFACILTKVYRFNLTPPLSLSNSICVCSKILCIDPFSMSISAVP